MGVKVGDRVKLLRDDDCDAYERGDIVMVSEVDDDGVYFNDNDDDRRYLVFEDFEPVAVADSNGNQHGQPKFKVGDRVRVVRRGDDDGGSFHSAKIGDEFTVTKIYDEPETEIHTNVWYFYPHEIEPVGAPLTIQAGGYYRTRDGRKVGPAKDMGHYFNLNCWDYNAAGKCGFEGRDNDEDYRRKHDIIAEWTDEPVLDTSTTGFTVPLDAPEFGGAESKFKVGDRVHYSDYICEGVGIITESNGDDDWYVAVEEKDREWAPFDNDTTRVFDSADLRLVAKATSGKDDEPDAIARIQMCDVIEAKEMARAGIFTINEVRKKFGLPPIVNGEALAA